MAVMKHINKTLQAFIASQGMFFVATAAREGRVNLSPKGMDTLRILDQNTILWLNLTGSGNETAAHVLEIPRMTLMFCAFDGDARIVRVYGNAGMLLPGDDDWEEHAGLFPKLAGSRQIFKLEIDLVQTSCGTGVPIMEIQAQRGYDELVPFYEEMGEDGVKAYWKRKNAESIDGKPTGI